MLDEPHLMSYITMFKDALWEGGQLKQGGPPRTAEEKLRTRDDANRKLSALIPGSSACAWKGCLSANSSFLSCRFGREHDRTVECQARGKEALRCASE